MILARAEHKWLEQPDPTDPVCRNRKHGKELHEPCECRHKDGCDMVTCGYNGCLCDEFGPGVGREGAVMAAQSTITIDIANVEQVRAAWDVLAATIATLTDERDRARLVAVALEQECAALRDVFNKLVVFQNSPRADSMRDWIAVEHAINALDAGSGEGGRS